MINIREFSENDVEEITELMKKLCLIKGREFDENRWRESLQRKKEKDSLSEVIVAYDDDNSTILGMGQCSIKTSDNGFKFGYISNLIVREDRRRAGIGEKIIRKMIEYFRGHRIHSIRIALEPKLREGAILLFTKLGFKEMLRIYELKI